MNADLSLANNFRVYLQAELIRRCKLNPLYSLRAFARTMVIEPSFLSKILTGKRSITEPMLFHCASRLGLSSKDVLRFRDSCSKRKKMDTRGEIETTDYKQLAHDHFQMIADWYHYAILELITVKKFKPSYPWISKALGITVSEVRAAIERLIRLGFLEINTNSQWVNKSGNNTTLGNRFTAVAFRCLQKQILEGAIRSLEEVSLEERSQTAMTMAIDSKLLPKAKKKIISFQRRLCRFLQLQRSRNEVYQLSISLYPVTHFSKGKV